MSRTYFRVKPHRPEVSALNTVCSEKPNSCNCASVQQIIWISQEKQKTDYRILHNDNGFIRGARVSLGQGRPVHHLTAYEIGQWVCLIL
jgi:hypothetical protein